MLSAYLQGAGIGLGLITAIGAQNAFVLSQGVRRNHHIAIALICSLCDAVLIGLGVAGVGTAFAGHPVLRTAAALGGAAFLLWYGLKALLSAFKNSYLEADSEAAGSLKAAICTTLAVTLFNPHVYIDTVIFLGGVSSRFEGAGRYYFGLGAATGSFIWFFSLSLGGRLLAPLFKKSISWKILDCCVCLVMWVIAGSLVMQTVNGY